MVHIQCVWEEPAILGEGPLWVAKENVVYWVDIVSKKVHRYGVADDARRTWAFETVVTSLADRRQGGLVGTVRDGFAFIDLEAGTFEPIAMPEADMPENRFNDGKVDENGRYWAGSMDDGEKLATGSLYRLDGDLALHKMDTNYSITNGPTFSVDGKTLYHTDTAKRTIFAFDFNEEDTRKYPLSGSLFSCKPGVTGLPTPLFAG